MTRRRATRGDTERRELEREGAEDQAAAEKAERIARRQGQAAPIRLREADTAALEALAAERREDVADVRSAAIQEGVCALRGGWAEALARARRRDELLADLALRSTPPLTEAEASLIADTLNGSISTACAPGLLAAELEDACALAGLASKWGVDGAALVARARTWTPGEVLAVLLGVEAFWGLTDKPTGEALRLSGLVRGTPGRP